MSFQQKVWIAFVSFTAGFYTHKFILDNRRADIGEPKDWVKKTEQLGDAIRQHPERVPKAANKAIRTILEDDANPFTD